MKTSLSPPISPTVGDCGVFTNAHLQTGYDRHLCARPSGKWCLLTSGLSRLCWPHSLPGPSPPQPTPHQPAMAMSAPFRAPTRKRWPREPYDGPFPVPIHRRAAPPEGRPLPDPPKAKAFNTDAGPADSPSAQSIGASREQPGSIAASAGPHTAVENDRGSICGNLTVAAAAAAVTLGEGRKSNEGRVESEGPECYRGELVHGVVLVRDHRDMEALYGRGFFGKGFFSKGRPLFSETPRFTPQENQPCPGLRRDHEKPGALPGTYSAEADSTLRDDIATRNGNVVAVKAGPCPRDRGGSDIVCGDGDDAAGLEGGGGSAARADSAHAAQMDFEAATAAEEGAPDESREPVVGRRQNTERIAEHLQLGLEEAFFLVYALGCLIVSKNEEALSLTELWRACARARPRFRTLYPAYHYFRSRGWVPKPGLKYGTDLLLYRKGPTFYHASYSVVVETVDGASYRGDALRHFSWRSLAGLNRMTMNVSKELLLCFVVRPAGLTEEALSSPACLRHLRVQEVVVGRWMSGRERGDRYDMDL